MNRKTVHTGKTAKDRERYFASIKKHSNEQSTIEEAGQESDRTDSLADEFEINPTTRRARPRPFNKKVETFVNNKWIWGIIIPIFVYLISFFVGVSRDIGKLEERTQGIPAMNERVFSIDKNIELLKKEIEKGNQINDIRFDNIEKDLARDNTKK